MDNAHKPLRISSNSSQNETRATKPYGSSFKTSRIVKIYPQLNLYNVLGNRNKAGQKKVTVNFINLSNLEMSCIDIRG